MSGEVVVLGSMNLDIFVQLDALPRPGETKSGTNLFKAPGGKSSNQAVAIAKSGITPVLIAGVGDDSDGRQLVELAASQGVDVRHVLKFPNVSTGTAFVMVDHSAENFIVVVPGANGALDVQTVETELSKLDHQYEALVVAMEVDAKAVRAAMLSARQNSALTFLNPSPFTSDAVPLISLADFVIVNQGESESLATELGVDVEILPSTLSGFGVQYLVVTQGAEGCVYHNLTSDGIESRSYSAPRINPIDTTGCGDAFLGSLVSIYVQTRDVDESIKFALKAASYAAISEGAQPSYGQQAEVEAAFSNHNFF